MAEPVPEVHERSAYLAALADEPLDPQEIGDRLDVSRATVSRAMDELTEAGLVEKTGRRYRPTTFGRVALDSYETYHREWETLSAASSVVEALPDGTTLPRTAIVGGEVVDSPPEEPYRPQQRLRETLRDASDLRAWLPRLPDPTHVQLLYEHVVVDGNRLELVVPESLSDRLGSEWSAQLAAMLDQPSFELRVTTGPAYGTVVTESQAAVVVFGGTHAVGGVIDNATPAATAWATDRLDGLWTDATVVASIDGPADRADAADGPALPPALERQGFVRLRREFFVSRSVRDPPTAWRAGLGLPEVHTGYAVERTRPDGTRFLSVLLDELTDGNDVAVVGPPGTGKSTTLKQTACAWYEEDRGPVVYRVAGRGQAFDAPDRLADRLDGVDGTPLIVVEDAVRPDAVAVFELLGEIDARVLVDAREQEWTDAIREREAVSPETVAIHRPPPLHDSELDRLVAHVERTTGSSITVSTDRLRETVRQSPIGREAVCDAASDELLLLLHRLASSVDPLADQPTTLEATVESVRSRLAGRGERDVGLAVNLLNAAGLPVEPELLSAVAGSEALERATRVLSGQVVFDPADDGPYRTVHEEWSVTYLRTALETDRHDVQARAERVLDAVFDATSELSGDDRRWADQVVTAVFSLAEDRPVLVPLIASKDRPRASVPADCSDRVRRRVPLWLGRALLNRGDFERATRVFERLAAGVDADRLRLESLLGRADAAFGRGDYDEAETAVETAMAVADRQSDDTIERTTGENDDSAERVEDSADRVGDSPERVEDSADRIGDSAVARVNLTRGKIERGQGAYEAAAEALESAVETFDRSADRSRLARALVALGEVDKRLGEPDRARRRYERSLGIARELRDRRQQAVVLLRLGVLAYNEGNYDAAADQLDRCLGIFQTVGDRQGEADALRDRGLVAYRRGAYAEAESYYERSLSIATDLDDEQGMANALNNLGLVAYRRGEYADARGYYERSLAIKRKLGDEQGRSSTLINLGLTASRRGNYDQARRYYERSLELKRELGHRRGELNARINLGEITKTTGRFDAALTHDRAAVEVARDLDDPLATAKAMGGLGSLLVELGDYEEADDRLREALELATDVDAHGATARTRMHLGRLAVRRDDDEAATRHLERAVSNARAAEQAALLGECLAFKAEIHRQAGELDAARVSLDRAAEAVGGSGGTIESALVALIEARVALDRGESRDSLLDDAADGFESVGARHWVGRCRLLRGRIAADRGATDDAVAHWEAALDAFEAAGAVMDAAAVVERITETTDADADRLWDRVERRADELDISIDRPREVTTGSDG